MDGQKLLEGIPWLAALCAMLAPDASAGEVATVQKTVLLIDDDPGAHILLRAIMDWEPPERMVNLVGAMTFDGGLRVVREQKVDVCLLDLNLTKCVPSMTAAETIEAMRLHMAEIVPTLIITGEIEPGSDWTAGKLWKQARMAGAVGFLRKDRYLDPRNREFLLHEFADAMLEFCARGKCTFAHAHAA